MGRHGSSIFQFSSLALAWNRLCCALIIRHSAAYFNKVHILQTIPTLLPSSKRTKSTKFEVDSWTSYFIEILSMITKNTSLTAAAFLGAIFKLCPFFGLFVPFFAVFFRRLWISRLIGAFFELPRFKKFDESINREYESLNAPLSRLLLYCSVACIVLVYTLKKKKKWRKFQTAFSWKTQLQTCSQLLWKIHTWSDMRSKKLINLDPPCCSHGAVPFIPYITRCIRQKRSKKLRLKRASEYQSLPPEKLSLFADNDVHAYSYDALVCN